MTILTISLTLVLNALLILAIILPILIFPIYFTTHPQQSSLFNINQVIPTISLAGGLPPESIIFTSFMHLISICIAPLYISIYITYRDKLNNIMNSDNQKCVNIMNRMNGLSLWLGLLASISMYLTGSVSVNYEFTVHFAFAVCIFIPASVHIIIYRIMIYIMTKNLMISIPSRQVTLTVIAFHITVTFNIIVLIIDIIIYFSCFSHICRSYVVDVLPVLEFTTVIAFLIYFESFRPVYSDVSITMNFRNNNNTNNTNHDNISINDDDNSSVGITHTVI